MYRVKVSMDKNVRFSCERIRLTFFLKKNFLFIFLIFFFLLLATHTMEEHMHKILVVLGFTMAMHQIIAKVGSLQQVAIA